MIRVGIIGGGGYAAGELIRLLVHHPEAEISFIHSNSQAGLAVTDVHEGLLGDTDLRFSPDADLNSIDVLFLCMGHGKSQEFWQTHARPEALRVIDLAQDFRNESEGYVYGLPEYQRERICGARLVANPGCFATAIQLALLPLAAERLLTEEVHVTALTGSTGAGVKPAATTHFSWRSDNVSVYKPFAHQHLLEIGRTLSTLGKTDAPPRINFIPMRGDWARGIFASVYTDAPSLSQERALELYASFYEGCPFTQVSEQNINLKQVTNTNKAIVHVEKHGTKLLALCAIDNLLKGASGQAVQNMNLMCGLGEKMGLNLKPNAF